MQFKTFTFAALASTAVAQTMNLTATLANQTQLSSLTGLLSSNPALLASLSNATNITILAPSNSAISAFQNSSSAQAAANPSVLTAILQYHVLNGTYYNPNSTAFIPTSLQPTTYTNVTGGQRVGVTKSGNGTHFISGLFDNSTVTSTVNFTGGVIHVIDRLLTLPQNISTTAVAFNLTSVVGALTAANLANAVDTLADLTVFVPNNAAFQSIGSALPNLTTEQITNILQYHVVNGTVGYSTGLVNGSSLTTLSGGNLTITLSGSNIFVNSARVVIPNVLVANGVVHVIDEVLNPGNSGARANATATAGSPAFSGASSGTVAPFTSGVPTPTSSIDTSSAAQAATSAAGGHSSSSSSGAAWVPRATGAVNAAALLGGAALVLNM